MTPQEAISTFKEWIERDKKIEYADRLENIEIYNMAIKAIEQQPCEDCVKREDVKDMLTEEWTKYMPMELDINLSFVLDKINELPSVTPTEKREPCEDTISRTALLSRIDEERKHLLDIKMDGAEHIVVHHARRIIEEMPSVTPSYNSIKSELEPCEDWKFYYKHGYTQAKRDLLCKWIPVSERLPEECGCYLITTMIKIHDLKPYYEIRVAQFDGKDFDIGYIGDGFKVIAWRPLPESYKEVEE